MASHSAKNTLVQGDRHAPDAARRKIESLRELITALDARVPRLERVGEVQIARDAAGLKQAALKRLAEIDPTGSHE